MNELEAGFGAVEITPDNMGFSLKGYGNRKSNATGVHDSIWAKALVIRRGAEAWALCGVDLCWVDAEMVAEVRQQVSEQTGLQPSAVLIAATHTHSGPHDLEAGNWNKPFAELVAGAIVAAWRTVQPARLAHGGGFLYGHAINRRWFDRPVDPGVGVLRIDSVDGKLLGIVVNYGCHPVVMGYDNFLVSADYVGYATRAVQDQLGGLCIFTNGGCGDINPLTETVRRQLAEGHYFVTMARDARFYGEGEQPIHIGDRGGGTFEEAEVIGKALAKEVCYVAQGLTTQILADAPWSVQAQVNHLDDGEEYLECQALGIGDFALMAEPGEVFSESALDVKAKLRALGYRYPWLTSYANDWQYYMVPEAAFPEGGYEVDWAVRRRHSPQLQRRFWESVSGAFPDLR